MKGIIYKVTNKINNKVYIGETIRPLYERQKEHYKNAYIKKCKFQNALNKYNEEDFVWEIIEVVEADQKTLLKKQLHLKEEKWIAYYDSFNNGYNNVSKDLGIGGAYKEIIIDKEKFLSLCKLGYTRKQLAEYFQCKESQIREYRKRLSEEDNNIKQLLKQYNKDAASARNLLRVMPDLSGSKSSRWIEINIDWDKHFELAKEGKSRKEIAEYFNISEQHLKIWRKRMRNDPIKKQLLDGTKYTLTKQTGIKRRASNKVSQDIINQISKCFYEGKSIMTTHKELQLPFKTVRHIREQLGLRK
jgi:group I intron endonuclease